MFSFDKMVIVIMMRQSCRPQSGNIIMQSSQLTTFKKDPFNLLVGRSIPRSDWKFEN